MDRKLEIFMSVEIIIPSRAPSGRRLTNKRSVGTIAYHCTEALECPLFNNKTIVPRFMIVYNSSIWFVYNKHKRRSYILIILKSRNFPDYSTR